MAYVSAIVNCGVSFIGSDKRFKQLLYVSSDVYGTLIKH
jgi:hypothetical protein